MKGQLNLRVFTTNRSIWRREIQISPKIESLYGLGSQATRMRKNVMLDSGYFYNGF